MQTESIKVSKLNWMPDNLKKEIGHFNVFRLDDFTGTAAKPMPYSRKDFFKISLIMGRNRAHYPDKVVEHDGYTLLFANPKRTSYKWEPLNLIQSGHFCIFTERLAQFGNIKEYPVFQPGGDAGVPINGGTDGASQAYFSEHARRNCLRLYLQV